MIRLANEDRVLCERKAQHLRKRRRLLEGQIVCGQEIGRLRVSFPRSFDASDLETFDAERILGQFRHAFCRKDGRDLLSDHLDARPLLRRDLYRRRRALVCERPPESSRHATNRHADCVVCVVGLVESRPRSALHQNVRVARIERAAVANRGFNLSRIKRNVCFPAVSVARWRILHNDGAVVADLFQRVYKFVLAITVVVKQLPLVLHIIQVARI